MIPSDGKGPAIASSMLVFISLATRPKVCANSASSSDGLVVINGRPNASATKLYASISPLNFDVICDTANSATCAILAMANLTKLNPIRRLWTMSANLANPLIKALATLSPTLPESFMSSAV